MNTNLAGEAIRLPATLNLTAAGTLLADLQNMTGAGTPAVLDASRIESLSYAASQVMLSWARTQPGALVVRPSTAFLTALSDLGLDGHIPVAFNVPLEEVAEPIETPLSMVQESVTAPPQADAPPGPIDDAPSLSPVVEPAPTLMKRILTIDDSKTMRDMLRLTLVRSGFDVLQAVDGCDGLDVLSREAVDVIITDINMPRMDGYGVIENVRRDTKYDATPILVLTTENDREKKDRARDLGATGFIVKPFDPSKLVDVIYKVSP